MSIRLIDGTSSQPFTQDMLYDHILSKCVNIDTKMLDIKRMATNVYPKLLSENTIKDIDNVIVSVATNMMVEHYDYEKIAVRILIDRLHSTTHEDYAKVLDDLLSVTYEDEIIPIVSEEYAAFARKHMEAINAALDYSRDYDCTVFGFRTLERAYLQRDFDNRIIERPQHMFMREALGIHYAYDDIDRALHTYQLLSKKLMTHATPTIFNAGTTAPQLSSCFLLSIDDDKMSINKSWMDCGTISMHSGGISVCVSHLRAKKSFIRSTRGEARGLEVAKIYNEISRYADQGGKRPGSIALYVEPWHADIYYFLNLKKNTGPETERARDIFMALMVNDLFMHRVKEKGSWALMCPAKCPNIVGKYGEEFEQAYLEYEAAGKYVRVVPAEDLWFKIMETQIEAGMPYIIFKDAMNYKSNQKNIGVINSSNLCAEIAQVSTSKEYAVCNLASICLPRFVIDGRFDYQALYQVVRTTARNLNRIIDINYYPVPETKVSNLKHRPMAIGVQGLAEVFAMHKTPFDSALARELNKNIFETIYFAAMTESMIMSKESQPYETFAESPLSEGKFQFDLWGLSTDNLSGMWDWESLRSDVIKYGVTNSLLTACMPTASTSQIMGNNEAFEPHGNFCVRTTGSGSFYIINKHLVDDLVSLDLWNEDTINLLKYYDGSVQNIPGVPDDLKRIYRTVWEIPQRSLIEMSAERGPFIDQTQSLNLFLENPTFSRLNACLMKGWELGLKTGSYYVRTRQTDIGANKFSVPVEVKKKLKESESQMCKIMRENGKICFSCSG